MNYPRYLKYFFAISLPLCLSPLKNNAQSHPKDTLDLEYVNAAREIMSEAGTCALITLDKEGRPRVRVMDPFSPESDLTVWLATNPASRKVEQIRDDPRVTLYYLAEGATGYVMMHGSAKLVDDQNEKVKRWKDEWAAFYPDYPAGYLLIRVSPDWLEVVSYTHGIVGDSITWKPPVVYLESQE